MEAREFSRIELFVALYRYAVCIAPAALKKGVEALIPHGRGKQSYRSKEPRPGLAQPCGCSLLGRWGRLVRHVAADTRPQYVTEETRSRTIKSDKRRAVMKQTNSVSSVAASVVSLRLYRAGASLFLAALALVCFGLMDVNVCSAVVVSSMSLANCKTHSIRDSSLACFMTSPTVNKYSGELLFRFPTKLYQSLLAMATPTVL